MKESDIIYEAGNFWVSHEKGRKLYMVWRSGITHSICDSAYPDDADGKSLAVARTDYLNNRRAK